MKCTVKLYFAECRSIVKKKVKDIPVTGHGGP
jgi:hypothetical protein